MLSLDWRPKMLSPKLGFAALVVALTAVGLPHPAHAVTVSIKVPANAATACASIIGNPVTLNPAKRQPSKLHERGRQHLRHDPIYRQRYD